MGPLGYRGWGGDQRYKVVYPGVLNNPRKR